MAINLIAVFVVWGGTALIGAQNVGSGKIASNAGPVSISAEQRQQADIPPALPPITEEPAQPAAAPSKKLPRKYDITRIGQRGIGKGVNFYSLEREQMMGRELAEEVDLHVMLITDPQITEFVNRVAQNIVRHSDAVAPFFVKVVDSDEVNAFSLPGGYLYVNTALIVAAESEAALAGVMAHEVAHVAARHATKNQTKANIFNLASIPLVAVGGPAGAAVRQAASLAVPLSLLKFGRNAEREADLLSIQYIYAAGYDPAEFVAFFERMRLNKDNGTTSKTSSFLAGLFSTHPVTEDRLNRARQEIATMLPPRNEYIVTTSDFEQVVRRLTSHDRQLGTAVTPVLRRRMPSDGSQDRETSNGPNRPILRKRSD